MPLITQTIKGRSVNRVAILASEADLTDVLALLEGEVTQYKEEGTAGTSEPYPYSKNTKKFSVRKDENSVSVTIRHCKASVGTRAIRAAAIGKLDCDWETAIKAEKLNLFYDSSKNGGN
ncbi:hypothetical protein [Sulfurimonas sp.]|uniref:hypothetical protein n=1 Tax=Sulfurimonas sp. TaxID=2022749 RepID=UPI002B4A158C|nr:hypothetical protein [Sulfurimonas sp.]